MQWNTENSQEKQHETNDQLSAAYSELEEKRKLVDKLKIECESARNTIKEDNKLKLEVGDEKNILTYEVDLMWNAIVYIWKRQIFQNYFKH